MVRTISSVMNCEQCGKFVSLKTAGEIITERSDFDGIQCVIIMKCVKCAELQKGYYVKRDYYFVYSKSHF